MKVIGFLLKIPFVIAGALAGNQVGYIIREEVLGKPGHNLRFIQKGEEDEITIALNPVMTNFLPAVFTGLLKKPASAFVFGLLIAALIGDDYEAQFWAMLGLDGNDKGAAAGGSVAE